MRWAGILELMTVGVTLNQWKIGVLETYTPQLPCPDATLRWFSISIR